MGYFATLAPFVVPRLVSAVAATHPHLRVEVTEDDAAGVQRAVLDGRTELAVLYGIDLRPSLEATTVMHRCGPTSSSPPTTAWLHVGGSGSASWPPSRSSCSSRRRASCTPGRCYRPPA